MKCIKCRKKAIFNSPDPLCRDHWIDWWTEDQPGEKKMSDKDRETLMSELRALINKLRTKI